MTLGEFGRSDVLIGSAEYFNKAPWLAHFVQFFVSWAVIIGFLMYYFSYLCTLVYLSNKEFFNQVDIIKSGDSGGDGGRMSIKGFMQAFKSSDKTQKRLTGIDNIVVFVMMLSPNFKAYSMYAGVEADGGSEGENRGFNAKDTMGQFFLKSLPQSILVLFILGMALSGLLLRILFQCSDVLTLQAEKFASTNLQVMIARLENGFQDDFWYGHTNTVAGDLANKVAGDAMIQIRGNIPDMNADHIELARQAIESQITGKMIESGNDTASVALLIALTETFGGDNVKNDERWKAHKGLLASAPTTPENLPLLTGFSVSTSLRGTENDQTSFVIDLQEALNATGLSINLRQKYLYIMVRYDMDRFRQVGASTRGQEQNNSETLIDFPD